jgi:hypothetical protein
MLPPDSPSRSTAAPRAFPFAALQDVNERCLDLLAHAARTSKEPPFSLVASLREPLRRSTAEGRRVAASRGVLLVDMQFDQRVWWHRALGGPERQSRNGAGSGAFPRQSGIELARATMTLAWNAVQTDRTIAPVVLGMDAEVVNLIASMPLTGLDRFATRHFRRIRPRWADRVEFWRELLSASEAGAGVSMRDLDLKAMRILLADLLRAGRRTGDREKHQ